MRRSKRAAQCYRRRMELWGTLIFVDGNGVSSGWKNGVTTEGVLSGVNVLPQAAQSSAQKRLWGTEKRPVPSVPKAACNGYP